MARTRIDGAAFGRRRKMQNDVGQPGDSFQASRTIEVGDDRPGAAETPECHLCGVTQQGEYLIMAEQTG